MGDRARSFATQGDNRLLQSFPAPMRAELARDGRKVSLGIRTMLYKPNEPITHIYFRSRA